MNKESIEQFFIENGVYDDDHLPSVKNLFVILETIYSQEAYDEVVTRGFGLPRNPYRYTTKIRPGKEMLGNLKKRVSGAVSNIKLHSKAKIEYSTAIFLSAIMMYKMGYYLSYDEIQRVIMSYEFLESNRDKLSINLSAYESDYKDAIARKDRLAADSMEYREKLSKALSILNNDEEAKEVFHDIVEDEPIDNIEIIKDVIAIILYGKVNFNEKANINASRIRILLELKDKGIESYESAMNMEEADKSYGVDISNDKQEEEYYNILQKIYEKSVEEQQESRTPLSYCLYQNLNNELVYNTIAFSWSQDNERIKDIIKHHRSVDINEGNNAVTCHTWSSAMRELLTMGGYDAYIVGEEGHQFVLFFDEEGNPWVADGTNAPMHDRPNWFMGADLTRTKLGLAPNYYFQILGTDEYIHEDNIFCENGVARKGRKIKYDQFDRAKKLKFDIDDYRKEDGSIDYKAIFSFIDNNPEMMDNFANAIKETHDGSNMVVFLNEALKCLIQGHEEDDLLLISCVNNLVYILKDGKVNSFEWLKEIIGIAPAYSIGNSHDLYKKVGDRTKMVPLIYIKEDDNVNYYIWDDTEGFTKISKEELIEKINLGEYHSSKNNGSKEIWETRAIIPGIRSPRISKQDEEKAIFGEKKSDITVQEDGWVKINCDTDGGIDID